MVGYQAGRKVPAEVDGPTKEGKAFLHDPTSLRELWAEIGGATGTGWKVEATLDETDESASYAAVSPGNGGLSFSIERTD